MIFCIENNRYGMGTSIDRHSSIQDYYKMGNAIPGLRIDGMNVLAVKEGMKFAKEYCGSGNGPMYVEMMTYRYHGHSMSDPGTTYRNRDEIAFTRSTKDPLEFVKKCLVDAEFMTTDEIKDTEKRIVFSKSLFCSYMGHGSGVGFTKIYTSSTTDTHLSTHAYDHTNHYRTLSIPSASHRIE